MSGREGYFHPASRDRKPLRRCTGSIDFQNVAGAGRLACRGTVRQVRGLAGRASAVACTGRIARPWRAPSRTSHHRATLSPARCVAPGPIQSTAAASPSRFPPTALRHRTIGPLRRRVLPAASRSANNSRLQASSSNRGQSATATMLRSFCARLHLVRTAESRTTDTAASQRNVHRDDNHAD